ncbi:MAG: LPS-assembly protein LptD [Burkholderiales bacterium]|nr:MAG: LPS-assembly protein LptD [Burkholderiales bacterium]
MRLPSPRTSPQPRIEWAARPIACAVACLCSAAWPVYSQTPPTGAPPSQAGSAEPALKLKSTPFLQERFAPEQKKQMPTYVRGDRITGQQDIETVIDGNAEIRRSGMVIRADRIEYYQPDDLAKARGNVYLNRDGNTFFGTEAQIRVDAQEGFLLEPSYQLLKNGAHGGASRIDFVDDKRSIIRNATYTTCRREPEGGAKPDWIIRASQVSLDTDTDVGQASDGRLEFKGVPILGAPYFSFPLSDARKSGWLPPSINLDNISGVETAIPYYVNLAPNRDATLYPGIMSRRGLTLGAEFRYLEPLYNGISRLDWMPSDRLRNRSRWGLGVNHGGTIETGIPSVGNVGISASLNRVSDNDYWRDFPRATGSLTQRLLANDGSLSWSRGPWSLYSRALKWQTLQQSTSVVIPPYDRLPQINGKYNRFNHNGFDYQVELDTTLFNSVSALTLQPNAQRSYALAQVSRPFLTPASFFTPKLQLHSSAYSFDAPLSSGPLAGNRSAKRVLPTFSLDSGLIFERNAQYFGRNITQTLEPRAFYTYTPYKDQSSLPIYDTGINDFNVATIFSENAFNGNDRISDNNLLTLGLTSRFLDPETGAEAMRLSFAQRLRFSDQRVALPTGTPDNNRFSDMLFGATVNWNSQWAFDGAVQYKPTTGRSERTTLGARYSPSNYRVLSANYRLNRDTSEQIDVGWQWPLNDLWGDKGQNLGAGQGLGEGRWYSVGRLNYSLRDKKLVDTLTGFEYDGGCWLARVAVERLQTTSTSANKRILFQLEFVGFARVGASPLAILQRNVPRYQLLREKINTSPSRFSNYD